MGRRGKGQAKVANEAPISTPSTGRWWLRRWPLWLAVFAVAVVGTVWALARETTPMVYDYEVVNTFPHDTNALCQGLAYADGTLYEGTGRYGASSLRRVELETGRVLQKVDLDQRYFGEGITVWQNQIIQLTWKRQLGLVYDRETFAEQKRFRYYGQGWGLTHDGRHLIMSDGTSTLRFLDPQTYQVVRRLSVRSQGRRIRQLNELEYVEGADLRQRLASGLCRAYFAPKWRGHGLD